MGSNASALPGTGGWYRTRTCPRCGSELYADMDVCYGCLYDFGREAARPGLPASVPVMGPGETMPLAAGVPAEGLTEEVGMLVRTASVDVWVAVPEEGLVVGRAPECDVVLHSLAVSRAHLRVTPTSDGMEARDLGSTNPARYRGREVRDCVIVAYGDSIDVCGCVLTMTGQRARGGGDGAGLWYADETL
ncbi:FHA domain-containing protein [Thermophilibacter sp.]